MKYIFIIVLINLCACATLKNSDKMKPELAEFTSDGCSYSPDGTPITTDAWLECCEEHDFHYWKGGTEADRKLADNSLKQCVEKKGYQVTSYLMYLGVRLGGSPTFATTFRWGYGWNYKREYKPLSASDLEQVINKIDKKQYYKYKHHIHRPIIK